MQWSLQKKHHRKEVTESFLSLWSWYFESPPALNDEEPLQAGWRWDTRSSVNYMNIDELREDPILAMSSSAKEEDESLWETLKTEVYDEKNL
jgi:hypothetical protein